MSGEPDEGIKSLGRGCGMPSNIEIKARAGEFAYLRSLAERISDTPGQLILQEDVFFPVPSGRLKLRVLAPDRGELIYYQRADVKGPRESKYMISRTSEPGGLKEVLTLAYGQWGVVRKRRQLFLAGQTRIHLDEVEGLGQFVELEFVLNDGQVQQEGESALAEIMGRLGIAEEHLIGCAYIDLLAEAAGQRAH